MRLSADSAAPEADVLAIRKALVPLILAVFPLLAFLPAGSGWSARAEPLWNRVGASEAIVLARVAEVLSDSSGMPEGTDRVARLEVVEVWKGAPPTRLEVPFNDYLPWPPAPHYSPGELIVAFLRRDHGIWTTVGMVDGTVHPRHGQLADLRARVRRVVLMQHDA
jgi:hypothetical protein